MHPCQLLQADYGLPANEVADTGSAVCRVCAGYRGSALVIGQILSGNVSLTWLLVQALVYDDLKCFGAFLERAGSAGRSITHNLQQSFSHTVCDERWSPRN